jgi:shikimate dehydrogenase
LAINKTEITAATRYCAVFGHPVKHSASPAMHNAALALLGFNWRYLAFDVEPSHLKEAIAGAQRMKFIGLNLTVPHKLLAAGLVDALDASAQQWGAVNTIRFECRNASGPWLPLGEIEPEQANEIRSHGFNTDADAVIQALREDLQLSLAGRRVLVLGAGGAGRVAALKLAAERVAELWLVNRTASKAQAVADEIQRRFPGPKVKVGYPDQPVDLVLNATSLGLKPEDALPLDERAFSWSQTTAVFDMIYRPAETPLLARARRAGCRTANGLGMLLYQGAKALEIWTGRPAPIKAMRQALEENVYGHL